MSRLSVALVAAMLLPGCAIKTRAIPEAPVPFASINYTVLGATSAESCGNYILGIDFGHLFSTQAGHTSAAASANPLSAIVGLLPIGGGPEESRALYDALEKMPEATHLLSPRSSSEAHGLLLFGFPFFGERCATVEAHGVKVGTGPVPNAN